MRIGQDFDKLQLDLFGLHLVEPNTFVGDTIIFFFAMYFAYQTNKFSGNSKFFTYWKWFFIVFGIGFFMGGLGHLLYNYWGVPGKYFSWYSGLIASCLIEFAMISIFPNQSWHKKLQTISIIKMIIAFFAATYVFATVDLSVDVSKGLIVPALNSAVGLAFAVGVLGIYYQKKIDSSFKFFWMSIVVLIPTAIVQSMKININQYFDRNDISHILLLTSLIFYYIGLKGYARKLIQN